MTGKSGAFTGSDCLPMRPDRHGFPKNRHGYFTNTSIWTRIDGMEPVKCLKKTAFSAVIAADNLRDELQYAGTRETGISDHTRIPGCSKGSI